MQLEKDVFYATNMKIGSKKWKYVYIPCSLSNACRDGVTWIA